MKVRKLASIFLLIGILANAQKKEKVLFTVDNKPVYTNEFIAIYKKNSSLVDESSKGGIASYLDLYVNYKLKVKEAFDLKLDTLQKFKNELSEYRENLIQPYLKDKTVSENLVKEAYSRLLKEVNVSHILIFLQPNVSEKDTLAAYNKLIEARNLILKGEDFGVVAKQYSQDPSAQQNGGEIGYFSGLQMVYPFENMAFNTPVNQVSMPFRTKYGYHILKVHDIRNSKGEVEVAHIMIKNSANETAKKRIDSIFNVLKNDASQFESLAKTLSDDKASAVKGGLLDKFGTGRMVESFANEAFKLKNEGEISLPFQTPYGWHIAKLIKKYPVDTFENMKPKLTEQVNKDERSNLIGESVIKKLFNDYKVTVNKESLQQFDTEDWKNQPALFTNTILSVENKQVNQSVFVKYLNENRLTDVNLAIEGFKKEQVVTYYKENIERLNPEFNVMYTEFKEGLLLFDLLEQKVWEKSKDTIELVNYFDTHKSDYENKNFTDIKGLVISDFQNYLEKQWLNELYLKYKVDFNASEKRKVLKLKI